MGLQGRWSGSQVWTGTGRDVRSDRRGRGESMDLPRVGFGLRSLLWLPDTSINLGFLGFVRARSGSRVGS